MRRLKIILVALAMVATTFAPAVLPTSPAAADHEFAFAHWPSGVHPVVRTPSCYIYSRINFCPIVADAAYFWQDRGFDQGYTPPLPQTGYKRCDNIPFNSINVCFVDKTHAGLRGGVGYAEHYTWAFNGDPQHLAAVQIFICANCQVPGTTEPAHINSMTVILRHEMGHALGLGHTYDATCVMNATGIYVGVHQNTCQHDEDALNAMYNHGD